MDDVALLSKATGVEHDCCLADPAAAGAAFADDDVKTDISLDFPISRKVQSSDDLPSLKSRFSEIASGVNGVVPRFAVMSQ